MAQVGPGPDLVFPKDGEYSDEAQADLRLDLVRSEVRHLVESLGHGLRSDVDMQGKRFLITLGAAGAGRMYQENSHTLHQMVAETMDRHAPGRTFSLVIV